MGKMRLLLVLLFITLAAACKKDMLHASHVLRLSSNTTSTLDNIHFFNDSVCIVAGGSTFYQSTILKSTDGGYTWNTMSDPQAPKEMYGMGVSANGVIYLSGVDGDVLHSSDSGKSWRFNRINNWLIYQGGSFATADTGIFVSTILQRQSTITRVDSTFNILDQQNFTFGLNNVYLVNTTTAYAIGYGTVMKTTDRGNTWKFQDVQGDDFTAMNIHGDEIWMCGSNGGIYHTYDGGNHWECYRNGNDITLPRYYLRCVVFKDELHGWAVGDNGKFVRSDDGGRHWAEYPTFTASHLRSVAVCPNNDLLISGDGGVLVRVTP